MRLESNLDELHLKSDRLLEMVDTKLDRLIDVIAGKGMIPLDSLKWVIIFVLGFTFAMQFGVDALKMLVR